MDRTSVSRNLALLEKKGLINRGRETAARKRPVALTRKGQARLESAYELWRGAQSTVEARLSRADLDAAMSTLRALQKAV